MDQDLISGAEVATPDCATSTSTSSSTSSTSSKFDVLFLGTGVSTGVPFMYHVVTMSNKCEVCRHAFEVPGSKNKRNNVSIAILYKDVEGDGSDQCVVVDVGKTMRAAMMTEFPKRNITNVNAILLTHDHADAILGMDDIRDFQRSIHVEVADPVTGQIVTGTKVLSGALPIYLQEETMATVKRQFGYLTNKPAFLNEEESILSRRIALLKFNVIEPDSEFTIKGLRVRSFPVYHGGTYISLGFSFGQEGEFVYISDVKIIPEKSMNYLLSIKIKTLVIDCLDLHEGIFPHMGLNDCLDIIEKLNPDTCYLTGMCCDVGFHEVADEAIRKRSPRTSLSFDGMYIAGMSL